MTLDGTPFVVERSRRLSRSLLWRLQRSFYDQPGSDPWSRRIVPDYVTANAFIARAYAQVVAAFVGEARPRRATQPLYIVELGSGPGRFAHRFLQRLLERMPDVDRGAPPITYVLTDVAKGHMARWRHHPAFAPLIARGLVDFARFDATRDQVLHLEHANRTLGPGELERPLIVIANYVFDSLPEDLFLIDGGELFESRVILTSDREEYRPYPTEMLERLVASYHNVPIGNRPYYGDPEWDRILDGYRRSLGPGSLPFPVAALECLRTLRGLSGDRLLVLAADKGYVDEESLHDLEIPYIARHGSISVTVNFHALGEYVRGAGGVYLTPQHPANHLAIVGLLLDGQRAGHPATRRAWVEAVGHFGPDDFFTLKGGIEKALPSLSIEELMSLMRLGDADPGLVAGCLDRLREAIPGTRPQLRPQLLELLGRACDSDFPLEGQDDLAFEIGVLFSDLEDYEAALRFFTRSLERGKPDVATLTNLALCRQGLGAEAQARAHLRDALARDPSYPPALALAKRLGPARAGATEKIAGDSPRPRRHGSS